MNPKKCAFAVSMGKFLGVVVHREGISADEAKATAVRQMPSPTSQDQLRSLIGKVSYLRRFVPGLAELTNPMMKLLKKDVPFQWGPDCEKGLARIKEILTAPQLMIPPELGKPLLLYISVTDKSLGALIAQEKGGVERPVYYLSRMVRGAECNYTPVERQCLALVYVAQRLRHYMLAHRIHLVSKSNPLRYLMKNPVPSS